MSMHSEMDMALRREQITKVELDNADLRGHQFNVAWNLRDAVIGGFVGTAMLAGLAGFDRSMQTDVASGDGKPGIFEKEVLGMLEGGALMLGGVSFGLALVSKDLRDGPRKWKLD